MKHFKTAGLIALGLVFLTSCASIATIEKDNSVNLADYSSYAWVEDVKDTVAVSPSGIQEQNLHTAINEGLTKAAWKESKTTPDVLIRHDVLIEKTTKESRNPVYTRSYSRPYYNPYLRRWSYLYYPSQFMGYDVRQYPLREGTLTITLIDAKTDKVIWQGWTTKELASNTFTSKELEKGVKSILRKFDAGK